MTEGDDPGYVCQILSEGLTCLFWDLLFASEKPRNTSGRLLSLQCKLQQTRLSLLLLSLATGWKVLYASSLYTSLPRGISTVLSS